MQSYSLARTRTRSRMLRLRLGCKVVQRQSPQKSTPTQPESNTKVVYMKKMFHLHHAVFRQAPCLVSKTLIKSRRIIDWRKKLSIFDTFLSATKQTVRGWCTCYLQCFDYSCNLLFIISHCSESFLQFFERVGSNFILALNFLWLVY